MRRAILCAAIYGFIMRIFIKIRARGSKTILSAVVFMFIGLYAIEGSVGLAAHAQEGSGQESCAASVLNTPIFWDAARLVGVKKRLQANDDKLRPAYDALIQRADKALTVAPYSVTDKTRPGPSGDVQDYVSLSRYYWPNPKTADGLPYIRKDGQSNPEINSFDFDRRRSQKMTDAVRDLSLAAYFSGDNRYADKAVRLAYTWFVDEDRRMNPNLKFAQGVPGQTPGREFGILDTRIYWDVMDSLWLLESADMVDAKVVDAVRVWFGNYAAWLITSDFGKKAKSKKNNHGTFYDAQLSHSLVFAGRCDLAKKVLKSGHNRTKAQIKKEGLMPGEIKRTKSLFYHAFNAEAFLRMSHLAQKLDVDFYDKRKSGAGSVENTVHFIASYAGRTEAWPYEEISDNVERSIWTMLKHAQFVDESEIITEALTALEYENQESYLNLLGEE